MSTGCKSASIKMSSISVDNGGVHKLKQHKPEQWEINVIGNFLLTLYHRCVIGSQNNWTCKEIDFQKEFEQFIIPERRVLSKRLIDVNSTDNIGTILYRCGFLFDTPTKKSYKVKSSALLEFRKKKLAEQDKRRVNNDASSDTISGPEDILSCLIEHQQIPTLQVKHEIDEDTPVHPLQYEGTTKQQRRPNYHPTNMSCCICQQDFPTMDGYEEHIQTHNDEKEFEFLRELSRLDSAIFSLSYRLCKNSHHFCFTIECKTGSMVIEKIIIVQSRSMFYVHNMRVPYDIPENGIEHFYVDSHLFAMFVEQPIVLICHIKDEKDTRIIEEHHFMRSLEFPKVKFAIKPQQLPSKKLFLPRSKLKNFYPPLKIRDALKNDFSNDKLMQSSNDFRVYVQNGKILQPQTMGPTLTSILQIEDIDTIKEYLHLMQRNVKIRSFGDECSIKLRTKQRKHIEDILTVYDDVIITTGKNIDSNFESLAKYIFLNKGDLEMWDTYVGQIQDINSGRVTFKCTKQPDLHRTHTIIFRPSRMPLRYQYRAMGLLQVRMQFLEKFLFPGDLMSKNPSSLSLELYNKSIYKNPEQYQAVRNIAEGPRNDATYIIFGPPGTGKTTTLVESILQVLKRKGTKILVTASSNAACDEVALRLCKALDSIDISRAIVRIYARSNEARIETIDDILLEHSNMYDNAQFYPDVEVLHQYRIVVCTMSVVAKLSTGKFGLRNNDGMIYTHLFIDEVAASTEVEALMAITSIMSSKSCLIIAGDHKQLGPIVKSKRAEELNLGVSLMDRLLERECYRININTGDYDRTIQSRLRLNFRSHPAIVNLYSGMYYNYELEAKANVDDVSLVKDWHMAPSKDYPIIFHSINGKTHSDCFSMYNSDELNIVMDYVKDLMYFGINGKPVRQCDIGIISPYKKQYQRIREQLNLRKWYEIETGSVEIFQGKEKEIIIVSFVRSGTSTLGFLQSPRRLNVTLSRAKSLLILIGNASTLSMNPDYDHIIKECQRHKTLIGTSDNAKSLPTTNANVKIDRRTSNRSKGEATAAQKLKNLKLANKNGRKIRRRRSRKGKIKTSGSTAKDVEQNKSTISKSFAKLSHSQPLKKSIQDNNSKIENNSKSKRDEKQSAKPAKKEFSSDIVKSNISNNTTATASIKSSFQNTQDKRQLQLQTVIQKLNQLILPANMPANDKTSQAANGFPRPATTITTTANKKSKTELNVVQHSAKKDSKKSSKSKRYLRYVQYLSKVQFKNTENKENKNNITSKAKTAIIQNHGQSIKQKTNIQNQPNSGKPSKLTNSTAKTASSQSISKVAPTPKNLQIPKANATEASKSFPKTTVTNVQNSTVPSNMPLKANQKRKNK